MKIGRFDLLSKLRKVAQIFSNVGRSPLKASEFELHQQEFVKEFRSIGLIALLEEAVNMRPLSLRPDRLVRITNLVDPTVR